VTLEDEDGRETPLSYDIWINTLAAYRDHPSSSGALKQLAEMLRLIIEINKHDPKTIGYLNSRANLAMKTGEFHYDED
tara:strand:- start:887 stop:1120 length:234 start_codon:yes stop_codon:yes gene_type:complete